MMQVLFIVLSFSFSHFVLLELWVGYSLVYTTCLALKS